MTCDQARVELPLHARGESADDLQEHLDSCGSCRAELAEVEETMAALTSLSVEPPPEELRAAVLGLVESSALQARLVHAVDPPRTELKGEVLAAIENERKEDAAPNVATLRARRLPLGRLVAAAAILLVGVVAGATFGTGGIPGLPNPPQSDVSGNDRIPKGHQTQIVALEGVGPRSAAVSHYRHDNFRITLSVEGFDPTPRGFHYAVWARGSQGDAGIGTFRLKRSDDFEIPFAMGVNPSDYRELVVTLEPNDGDPALTGRIITQGRFDPATVHHGNYDD